MKSDLELVRENGVTFEQFSRIKKKMRVDHELEDLREHIDQISFNINKVYQHAKDRRRKEFNKSRGSLFKKDL